MYVVYSVIQIRVVTIWVILAQLEHCIDQSASKTRTVHSVIKKDISSMFYSVILIFFGSSSFFGPVRQPLILSACTAMSAA